MAIYLIDFAKKSKITLAELTNRIKKNNTISKTELTNFFTAYNIKINDTELKVFYSELDPQGKGVVTGEKFIDILRQYYTDKPLITTAVEDVLRKIARHMKLTDKDLYSYFRDIDVDKDGFLDRGELAKAIVMLTQISASDIVVQNVLNHFDYTHDGRISLDEFVKTLEPFFNISTLKRQNTLNLNPALKQAKRRIAEIVAKNSSHLLDMFKIYGSSPGLITEDMFKKALAESKIGLNSADIDNIIENFVDVEGKYIKYQIWVEEAKDQYERENLAESQALSTSHGDLRRSNSAENIFRSLANSIKASHIKPSEVFNTIDSNKDGVISHAEFRTFFKKMDLNLTHEEITNIIKAIDIKNDGQIEYGEFIKALKL